MSGNRYTFSMTKRQADIIEWALKRHLRKSSNFHLSHEQEDKLSMKALELFQSKRDQFKNLHTRGRKKKC